MTVTGNVITALLTLLQSGSTVREAVTATVPSDEISEWLQYAIDAGVDPDSTAAEILATHQR